MPTVAILRLFAIARALWEPTFWFYFIAILLFNRMNTGLCHGAQDPPTDVTIRGMVTDDADQPASECVVITLSYKDGKATYLHAFTDANGRFSLDVFKSPNSNCMIFAWKKDVGFAFEGVEERHNRGHELSLTLLPYRLHRIHIVDAEQKPIANASLQLIQFTKGLVYPLFPKTQFVHIPEVKAVSDEDGWIQFIVPQNATGLEYEIVAESDYGPVRRIMDKNAQEETCTLYAGLPVDITILCPDPSVDLSLCKISLTQARLSIRQFASPDGKCRIWVNEPNLGRNTRPNLAHVDGERGSLDSQIELFRNLSIYIQHPDFALADVSANVLDGQDHITASFELTKRTPK